MTAKITKTDLLKVSARLMLIQSAWTMQSMQSEGFVFCLMPVLRKLFPDNSKLRRVINHFHLPINTHPFLVSILAGSILKMESEGQSQRLIISYLRTAMTALAALGDSYFHAVLAFSSMVAVLATLIFGAVAGLVTLLVMYNAVHFLIRFAGIFIGFRKGDATISALGKWIDSGKTKLLRTLTGIAGGFVISMIFTKMAQDILSLFWIVPIATGLVLVAFVLNLKRSLWAYVLPSFLLLVLISEVLI
ncbi:MAG: PTS system mannose/fructose/sorbose family transporter subunit IID [Deltaproteobacteria bacterium]|nr:PTS system mannose/fructose/sorbose family transporter subunit IID [Deltaproteobacteria bacterium]